MSDSRLEKFIYAICSMDVSDLPVPLSRIEKLWNCLITGETPDFEPLSRNEKYLMAMLDRYDISNLPAPMSRGEKLLYKIAVGETDLSDVPGYLSRYEELLKYLIENGGISGGDFEYVLYTLNQSLSTLYATVEKPVKSAILKGNTERIPVGKNIFDKTSKIYDGWLYQTGDYHEDIGGIFYTTDFIKVKPNTDIVVNNGSGYAQYDDNKKCIHNLTYGSTTTLSNTKYIRVVVKKEVIDTLQIEYGTVSTNYEEPIFELQSVKMPVLTTTGKNLFDGKLVQGYLSSSTGDLTNSDNRSVSSSNFIKVNGNETISISQTGFNGTIGIFNYDKDKKFLGFTSNNKQIMDGTKFIKFRIYSATIENLITNQFNIQVEKGSVSTPYEPYKTNILSVPIENHKGFNGVYDTVDCLTGEVIERIGEIELANREWIKNESFNVPVYGTTIDNLFFDSDENSMCDKLSRIPYANRFNIEVGQYYTTVEYIYVGHNNMSVSEFKSYIDGLSPKLQYQLKTPVVKTVDLTTVDQDGQPTKLKTFNDITHVEIKADNLIPSVDIEVATKISETLSTLDPQHHDISNTQNQLGQTINEQTENTDATMMATTEIYEQTL